jgi:hypothetical protein
MSEERSILASRCLYVQDFGSFQDSQAARTSSGDITPPTLHFTERQQRGMSGGRRWDHVLPKPTSRADPARTQFPPRNPPAFALPRDVGQYCKCRMVPLASVAWVPPSSPSRFHSAKLLRTRTPTKKRSIFLVRINCRPSPRNAGNGQNEQNSSRTKDKS